MDGEHIEGMQGHVIVCGLQGVGLRAVEQFSLSGTPVVVIDDDADPRRWRTLADWGVPHVRRHAHRGEGFEEAGLARARRGGLRRGRRDPHARDGAPDQGDPPGPPLVVQLANPSVARALERVSGPGSVLDVASLAAPSFVEACLLRPSHAIELAGIDFAVVKLAVEPRPETHDTFRAHFGHLAPVAIMPGGDAPMEMCPGRDHPLHAGDRVAVLGTVEELQRMEISTTRPANGPARSVGLARRIRLQVGIALEEGNRALAIVASALFALIVVGDDRAALRLPPRRRRTPTSASWPRCTSPSRPWRPSATATTPSPTRAPGSWLLGILLIVSGRGPGVDRVRALHQHSGEPAH